MIETGVDAESLDIDHGTVLAQTPVLPEPAPEPVLEVKRRRERRRPGVPIQQNSLRCCIMSFIWQPEGRIKTLQMK
jgi:hypothetical protein